MNTAEMWQLLCAAVEARYPVLASVWTQAPERFGPDWITEFLRDLAPLYGPVTAPLTDRMLEVIDGYAEFANDSMRNQVYFEKTGRYQASNYEEVKRACYFDEDHMRLRYLPGMWVSHHLWPQHYHMLRGFEHGLIPRIKDCSLFFEVGVGCGMYSKRTLELLPTSHGVGFDISQYALDFTGWMLGRFAVQDRYQLENRDIRYGYRTLCDFLICQEVLEHLEDPAEFCKWLFALIRPGGHAYITAALNAAHSDHIFLFETTEQLERMLRDAGFQPLHSQEEFAPGNKPRRISPSLSGFFCQRPL